MNQDSQRPVQQEPAADIPPAEIPEAAEAPQRRGISPVWVIPIVAALIGGWLVFQSATEEKTRARIEFRDAAGIEAGKTSVRLRNIKIGEVTGVSYTEDLSRVVVSIELTGIPQDQLTESTRFWVVRPRIGIAGVSGLDTLLSGAYIEMDPGPPGEPATTFVGLEEPENYQLGNPGTSYLLRTPGLGSLSRGSPVRYRGIDVGQVTRYHLNASRDDVEVEIFVRAPYDRFVRPDTRFWNTSGIDLELGAEGIRLDMDGLTTILAGGISFTNRYATSGAFGQAPAGSVFPLYDSQSPAFEETSTAGAPMKLYFENGVDGLAVGAPVEFKGLRLGTVREIGAEVSHKGDDILTYAVIEIESARLPDTGPQAAADEAERRRQVYDFFDKMVQHGLRAQLKTGNLLTGQSLVVLDIFPREKKRRLGNLDGLPVLPTMPETLHGLVSQLNALMARVDALPLESISTQLAQTTANLNKLIRSLNADEGGALGVQLYEAVQELGRAARAVRSTAEYLERHPESLIQGKQAEP